MDKAIIEGARDLTDAPMWPPHERYVPSYTSDGSGPFPAATTPQGRRWYALTPEEEVWLQALRQEPVEPPFKLTVESVGTATIEYTPKTAAEIYEDQRRATQART